MPLSASIIFRKKKLHNDGQKILLKLIGIKRGEHKKCVAIVARWPFNFKYFVCDAWKKQEFEEL